MKKLTADCRLKLQISEDGDVCTYKFTQPPFGGYLATIRTKHVLSCHNHSANILPNWFSRLVFSVTSGIRNYESVCRLVSDEKPYNYANFYRCHDRRRRDRFFAEIHEVDSECGCSFLIAKEDFDKVSSQIDRLLQTKLGEQDSAHQSTTAP